MTRRWLRYFGVIVPPIAWALSTQLGQITPYKDCLENSPWTATSCGLLLTVSIAAVAGSRAASTGLGKTQRFVVDAGFLTALAFVFALMLQEAATVLLDPCLR